MDSTNPARNLVWAGCNNVRDLGGLGGQLGRTRPGVVVRADNVAKLGPKGWRAARDYGIRTIIDLRSYEECASDLRLKPPDFNLSHVPLEDLAAEDFWDDVRERLGTPRYFSAFLRRFPERTAAVVEALAQSPTGGIVIHCGLGRDRTGIAAIVLLTLAEVDHSSIADDYALSHGQLWNVVAQPAAGTLASLQAADRDVVLSALDGFDVEGHLRSGGLSTDLIETARQRLVENRSTPGKSD